MNEVIKTTDLKKHYGKTRALDGMTITIKENTITGLIGRNGSGKTTLLKILAGILDITEGAVQVFGAGPMDNLHVLNKLVYTYHNMAYDPKLKLKIILYAYSKMFENFNADFAKRLMKYFGLEDKMKYKNLSQGMASIFNFICALSCRAPLTMLDEPVLGMDITVRKTAYEILLREFTEYPRTFIISSHLLSEIEGTLSDILLIEQGKVSLFASIDDVRQMAYRVDGSQADIARYTESKKIIAKKTGELSSYAIVYEPICEGLEETVKTQGLAVSPVKAEDLCVYLTSQKKEEELECLW